MDKTAQFFERIETEMAVTLATASGHSVTMRAVSPVSYQRGILIFTAPDSNKYRQMKANPHCCIAAGSFFRGVYSRFSGGDDAAGKQGAPGCL